MCTVLLRPFRPGDDPACEALIREATLSTVWPFFKTLATREATAQAALMSAAVAFVVAGWTLFWSLAALPLLLLLSYLGVWLAHRLKLRRHSDMADVPSSYQSDPGGRTGFWVAEVVEGGFRAAGDDTRGVRFEVEGEAGAEGLEAGDGRLVGTVAIVLKSDPDMRERPGSVAWLRRMAVDSAFRRRGLGARLVDLAVDHCARKGFRAVELITTEAHEAARCLYSKKGFEIVQHYQDQYLLGAVSINMLRFRKTCGGDPGED